MNETETFIYYSNMKSKFNVSVDVKYGRVSVFVFGYESELDHQGKNERLIKVQTLDSTSMVIPILMSDYNSTSHNQGIELSTDVFDQQLKYRIKIKAKKDSLYSMQILKYEDTFHIV
jgi:hypothetical protein